jgi:hypothetical protein
MATTTIKRHITGTGDQPIAAAAQPLYVKAGKRIHYNVAPGQFVAYLETNPGIPQTIAAADITAANVHKVRFAVGHSSDGVMPCPVYSSGQRSYPRRGTLPRLPSPRSGTSF